MAGDVRLPKNGANLASPLHAVLSTRLWHSVLLRLHVALLLVTTLQQTVNKLEKLFVKRVCIVPDDPIVSILVLTHAYCFQTLIAISGAILLLLSLLVLPGIELINMSLNLER